MSESKKPTSNSLLSGWKGMAISAVVAALVVCIGVLIFNSFSKPSYLTGTTATEDQLSKAVASYVFNGKTYTVSANDIFDNTGTLEQAKQSDGSYALPDATTVMQYVQSEVIKRQAEAENIQVSDDDLNDYLETNFQTTDVDEIASKYGLDSDKVNSLIKDSIMVKKLRDAHVSASLPEMPNQPTAPADNSDDAASADYASYIINLVGDEWDANTGTWASQDGPYYTALKDYTITKDSATYGAAKAAFQVAYQQYSTAYSAAQSEWMTYVNSLLSKCQLTLGQLNMAMQ